MTFRTVPIPTQCNYYQLQDHTKLDAASVNYRSTTTDPHCVCLSSNRRRRPDLPPSPTQLLVHVSEKLQRIHNITNCEWYSYSLKICMLIEAIQKLLQASELWIWQRMITSEEVLMNKWLKKPGMYWNDLAQEAQLDWAHSQAWRFSPHHYTHWTIKKRDILFLTISWSNLNRFL